MTLDELLTEVESIREKADAGTQDRLAGFGKQLKKYGVEQERAIEQRDATIAELKGKLAGDERVTRASPTEIARSFRAVIDEFQAEARGADEAAVAIKTLDLEVKALVEVGDAKTTLVLPSAGAQVDATTLSTLRVSFAAVPVVPAETLAPLPADLESQTKPKPQPKPKPTPRRRRAPS